MATRNRFDGNEQHYYAQHLQSVIDNAVRFHLSQYPLTVEHEVAVWHSDFAPELLAAWSIMQEHGYIEQAKSWRHDHMSNSVEAVVVNGGNGGSPLYAIRWAASQTVFIDLPKDRNLNVKAKFTYPVPTIRYGSTNWRRISIERFAEHCGQELADKYHEWCMAAAELNKSVVEAKKTAYEMLTMCRTVGQLRRMCPDILQYLRPEQQQTVAEQKRNSPFPDGWDTFDKSRVERMLMALARGHLVPVSEEAKSVRGNRFSWASFVRKLETNESPEEATL